MKSFEIKGYTSSIAAAISYGTNPLFALPMFARGMDVNSTLFYRYFFAVIIYGLWLVFYKKVSLKITVKEFLCLFVLAIIFSLSSLFLFDSFNYMEAGLACTILFSYPLMVALLSKIFFNETLSLSVIISLILVIIGICLLYTGNVSGNLNIKGIVLVLLSALSYAIYMVSVKHINLIKHIKTDKLTFYVMLSGLSVYVWNLKFCTQLQLIDNWIVLFCALMLALFPTIISLESITVGIKIIGATKTAILGALEPLTALFFGILLFGESLTIKKAIGIILILFGVLYAIVGSNKQKN